MENKFHEENYAFRLVNVSKKIVDAFKNEFKQKEYKIGYYFKNKGKYVISIPLKQKLNPILLSDFVKKNKISNYGLYCYMSSNRDMDGLSVPSKIVNFYKMVGGCLDFSYIFMDEKHK